MYTYVIAELTTRQLERILQSTTEYVIARADDGRFTITSPICA
jgi:hypothetical protein